MSFKFKTQVIYLNNKRNLGNENKIYTNTYKSGWELNIFTKEKENNTSQVDNANTTFNSKDNSPFVINSHEKIIEKDKFRKESITNNLVINKKITYDDSVKYISSTSIKKKGIKSKFFNYYKSILRNRKIIPYLNELNSVLKLNKTTFLHAISIIDQFYYKVIFNSFNSQKYMSFSSCSISIFDWRSISVSCYYLSMKYNEVKLIRLSKICHILEFETDEQSILKAESLVFSVLKGDFISIKGNFLFYFFYFLNSLYEKYLKAYEDVINSKNIFENDETFLFFMLLKGLLTKESDVYLKCIDILYDKITKDSSYIDSSSPQEKGLVNEECVRIINSLYIIKYNSSIKSSCLVEFY